MSSRIVALLGCVLGASLLVSSVQAIEAIRGQPFVRSYPFDEIGYVSRGARLSFDPFGRVALLQAGAYAVLNDTTWLDLSVQGKGVPDLAVLSVGPDRLVYYGARGVLGTVEFDAAGKLRPHPLLPVAVPSWVTTAYFDEVIGIENSVYFGSWRGAVRWDTKTKRAQFYETGNLSKFFRVGQRVYVSNQGEPIRYVDPERGTLEALSDKTRAAAVELAVPLDDKRTLLSFVDGRMALFDGATIVPWSGQERNDLTGRISALQQLADGGVAVAITGKGLFLLSDEGDMMLSLTSDQYHLITSLAAREPGVLWVGTESAVEKVVYGGALTTFGERLGLPIGWPIVRSFQDRVVIASDGKLYGAAPVGKGSATRFKPMETQPPGGAWMFAAAGDRMISGSQSGIYAREGNGSFSHIMTMRDLTQLVMVNPNLCYVIGSAEIALLQWNGEKWVESVSRIPGIKYAGVVHVVGDVVWIEQGPEGVARLSFHDGKIDAREIPSPWPKTPWINLGWIDHIVIFTGTDGDRMYFDEATQTWCRPEWLEKLLARSPFWLLRMRKDASGKIWATHRSGVVTFTPRESGYEMDAFRFDLGNDRDPLLQFLADDHIWISTERSLYHVEQDNSPRTIQTQRPALVSVMDARKNEEIWAPVTGNASPLVLSYDQNSLVFRAFSGGYGWRRPPQYRFRLNRGDEWTNLSAGSTLGLTDLKEGRHVLEIQTTESREIVGGTREFSFEILPPWYRTWVAYAVYFLLGALLLIGLPGLASYLARRRHRELEELVSARTQELEKAMEQLNDETRNAATLAERNRLAGEIHDSMQQGLSGAIIQLDTTLKMRTVTDDVRSRLNVVRNMISYARQEVQHAVWDMESPLLEGTDLTAALRKIAELVNGGEVAIKTLVDGEAFEPPRMAKHHLLRIAQEATTNAVRHAKAGQIVIELHYRPGGLSLSVADDGVGFVPDESRFKAFGHFGLRGLRARAEKIGGVLTITSEPGSGTVVRIDVPVAESTTVYQHAEAEHAD